MAKTKIILNNQSDLILTNAQIVGATGIVKDDLPGLVNDLANLDVAIDNEEASRISGDLGLSNEISTERSRIDVILDGSDINLDQFREVVAFVQSIDLTNDADLLAAVTDINGRISTEEAARIAGDAQLSTDLADLQSYVDTTVNDAISQLTSDLADETTARIADVDAEETRAIAAESLLQDAIDAEIAARIAADETLDGKIADIISNTDLTAIDSFTEVVDNLDAEIARAESAEESLDVAKLNLAGGTMTGTLSGTMIIADTLEGNILNGNYIYTNQISAANGGGAPITLVSNFDVNGNIIFGLPTPTGDNHATNKLYVDSADDVLQSNIDTEKGRIDAILDGSDVDLDQFAEVVAFVQSIDLTNDESLMNAMINIEDSVSQETSSRESADLAIQDMISSLDLSLSSNMSILTNTVDTEIADRISAIETVETSISDLINTLDASIMIGNDADAVLQSNIDTEKGRIDAILDGSTVDLDQFAEVVAFVQSIDMSTDDALLTAVTNINSLIDTEVARAIAAEQVLDAAKLNLAGGAMSGDINMVDNNLRNIGYLDASEVRANYLAGIMGENINLSTNIDAAGTKNIINLPAPIDGGDAANKLYVDSADAQLSSDLADLQTYVDTTVDSAIATLTSDLADETAARIADVDAEEVRAIAAEGVLQSNITAEANERAAEDITLQGNIDIEATRAQTAETAIASDLGTETAARIAGDSAEEARATAAEFLLTTNLSDEVSRATAAEGVLQSNIDTEKGRIDAILVGASANADNFAEIVAIINSVDTTNDQSFAGYVLSNDAALATEVVRAEAAEDALTADLSTEVSRATAAEGVLTSDLGTEVTRAIAAEATLTAAISAEEVSRIAGDASLQSSLNNEIADRIAADQAAQAALAAESTRAIDAEAVLTVAISAEVARAEAAELVLTTDFANIYSKKVTVNGTGNGVLTAFTFDSSVRIGSEMVYVNGLLMEEGEDYTTTGTGEVTGIEFFDAPITGMKVRAYGVYGI